MNALQVSIVLAPAGILQVELLLSQKHALHDVGRGQRKDGLADDLEELKLIGQRVSDSTVFVQSTPIRPDLERVDSCIQVGGTSLHISCIRQRPQLLTDQKSHEVAEGVGFALLASSSRRLSTRPRLARILVEWPVLDLIRAPRIGVIEGQSGRCVPERRQNGVDDLQTSALDAL